MKVAITLNDVVRDFTAHFSNVYENSIENTKKDFYSAYQHVVDDEWVKEAPPELKSKKTNINEKYDQFRLSKKYLFQSLDEFKDILYNEYAFEIFGTAKTLAPNSMIDLNLLYQEVIKNHSCTVLSAEINNSKPATLHFLSYNKCLANNIKFLNNYSKAWQIFDVIITANPYILKRKNLSNPKKTSIKILTGYNRNIEADYTFNSLNEVLNFYK